MIGQFWIKQILQIDIESHQEDPPVQNLMGYSRALPMSFWIDRHCDPCPNSYLLMLFEKWRSPA